MFSLHVKRSLKSYRINNLLKFSTLTQSNVLQPQEHEYTEKPEYPAIQDTSYKAMKGRQNDKWSDQIKNITTVEEKLIKLNIPRYYGYKCSMLNDEKLPYNCLPMIQHCTETVFNEIESLPSYYDKLHEKSDWFAENIKNDIEEALQFQLIQFRRNDELRNSKINAIERKHQLTTAIIEQINRVIVNSLSPDYAHLSEIEVDSNPRHESFWFVNGISPPDAIRKLREGHWQKIYANDPIPRPFQYIGRPHLAIRHEHPLPSLTDDIQFSRHDVPRFKYDPKTLGYINTHRHGTCIPGFWPGSLKEYGLISYQNRSFLDAKDGFSTELYLSDKQNLIHGHAIQSSFSWLNSISSYQGFTTFNDLTYPLSVQTIITDGQKWSFYIYQLNTTLVGNSEFPGQPNACWGTKEMTLFEEIDDKYQLVNFNINVLKNLISFYLNAPKPRDLNMKPYLGESIKCISDIEDDERRTFLERVYKHMVSNRPRHLPMYEIYNWEKIYKIDHDTKPLMPKRRPFELKINPFKRQMNEHTPKYIPKALRPEGPKYLRRKWEKTYYP